MSVATSNRLAGKVAIVTGAGQGIGEGIALAYAREGARVVVAELREHRAERTASRIREAGGEAIAVATDVGVRADVERMVELAASRFGRLDVLVNNAQGFVPYTPLEDVADEQMDLVLRTGPKATLWCMQAAFPHLRRDGGRIVNVISLAAERGDPGLGPYNAAKLGILALTRTAAREWGRHGILVNCIAPAAMSARGKQFAERDPERFQRLMETRPVARLGDPEGDIAPIAVFLATEESRYLTGHTLYADGGGHLAPS
ncbi:MAG: SDR family oxidoreductase [Deltaproteobacteria bacterium]|nr:SDR family oxidoreductase [Deltaproteobacteria bacterium]